MKSIFNDVARRPRIRTGAKAAGLALALSLCTIALPQASFAQANAVKAQVVDEPVQSEVRAVLMQYGRFVQHAVNGEVWIPTVTPEGWHPYPACHWVKTQQYGWFFDDKTPWGQIVHHYGRWFWDAQMGWAWDPGSEFSPGWVAWRTSPEWVGWAPLPPDQAFQTVSADQFNNSDQWTFMETAKFASGCDAGQVAPPQRIPVLLRETKWVTGVEYVDGIAVIVLPPYITGPFVNIQIGFDPWPAWYLVQTMIDFNFVWHNTLIFNVAYVCAK